MKKIGGILFFVGVISAVLSFLGRELIVLMWVDMWGTTIGWIIRGVLAIGGGILWLMGNARGEE